MTDNGGIQEVRKVLGDDLHTVHDTLVAAGEEGLDNATIYRWLIASNNDANVAVSRLKGHAAWRSQLASDTSKPEIEDELNAGICFVQGCDDSGRPLLIIIGRHYNKKDRNVEGTERLFISMMDAAVQAIDKERNPEGKIVCLIDLQDVHTTKNIDKDALSAFFNVLAEHYPERLGKLWLLDAPMLFSSTWAALQLFVDPKTRDKIDWPRNDAGRHEIATCFTHMPEVLPVEYGGKGQLRSVRQATQSIASSESHFKDPSNAQENAAQQETAREQNICEQATEQPQQVQTTWEYVTATVQTVLPTALLPSQQQVADDPAIKQKGQDAVPEEACRSSVDEQLIGTGVISRTELNHTELKGQQPELPAGQNATSINANVAAEVQSAKLDKEGRPHHIGRRVGRSLGMVARGAALPFTWVARSISSRTSRS